MLLAIDVGNTHVTLGTFEGDNLKASWRLATDVNRLADEYGVLMVNLLSHESIAPEEIDSAVIASVVPDLDPVFEAVCRRYFDVRPLMVSTGVRTGLRILYDSPREVGADRVADAVAAIKLYTPPLVLVDLGTATVFDAISKEGEYLGGAIAPGLVIAAEALFQRAARLYRVELVRPKNAIGRNTAAAVQAGVIYGYVGLVEAIVRRFKEELGGEAKVVATGGWAEMVAQETDVIDVVDPNLTLTGLRLIYGMNR
ncbi:MAG: type III pantothenate kinase [Dehalococcoidia bacterium SM23_28_2]|nr:MAG: type III pantothenate kinase [Dehalococcoidia bacterium SM23_28_2]